MAWMEGKLQPIDLLSALQMKRQRDEGGNSNRNAMEREQLKAMQEQNKMAELKRGLLTPGPKTRTMASPETIGFPEYQQEQEKIKYAAMATGQPLPNQGFIGGGGGDGDNGNNNSKPTPQEPSMTYSGPDYSQAPDTVQAASALGKTMTGGIPNQSVGGGSPSTIQELLADEQVNAAGYKSLLNQAGFSQDKTPRTYSSMMDGVSPVQGKIGKVNTERDIQGNTYLTTGLEGDMPKGLTAQEEFDLKSKRSKTERDLKDKSKLESDARTKTNQQQSELRRLNIEKLKMDPDFLVARPDAQQAILNMEINDQEKLLSTIKKWDSAIKKNLLVNLPTIVSNLKPGGTLNWGEILNPDNWK
jgi:hypothetical protein